MPVAERAFANSIVIAGSTVGLVFTPPLIAWLMVTRGWRETFYVTSVLGLMMAFLWWRYATDQPEKHTKVSQAELKLINTGKNAGKTEGAQARYASWWGLLRNRNLGLICLSYFLDSFVLFIFIFWFYLYLVNERGFSLLKGGVFNKSALCLWDGNDSGERAFVRLPLGAAGAQSRPPPSGHWLSDIFGGLADGGSESSRTVPGDCLSVTERRFSDEHRRAFLGEFD